MFICLCHLSGVLSWQSFVSFMCDSVRDIPHTEEIGLKIITTAKISNEFSRESPYISNTFSGESPNLQTNFYASERSPPHSKILRETRKIWRSKYFKYDLLRERSYPWYCIYSVSIFYRDRLSLAPCVTQFVTYLSMILYMCTRLCVALSDRLP